MIVSLVESRVFTDQPLNKRKTKRVLTWKKQTVVSFSPKACRTIVSVG